MPRRGQGIPVNTTGQRVVIGHVFAADWEEHLENDPVYFLMRNSYASIALFDKEYDRPGGEIFETQKLPSVYEGTNLNRTLILYNDEYTGTDIKYKSGLYIIIKLFQRAPGRYH